LRLGRVHPGKKTWGGVHRKWLASQAFAHLEQRIACEELMAAMDEARARVARLEKAIEEAERLLALLGAGSTFPWNASPRSPGLDPGIDPGIDPGSLAMTAFTDFYAARV
jgi:hypothetical protein